MTDPPGLALAIFGDRLPLVVRYADWLAGDGVERGLIGPRETDRVWERHLLNCAAAAALIPPGSSVIDVGSGAGLPGVVLAIARPDLKVTLVEPMLRRTAFLEIVVADLGLPSVKIHRARAEDVPRERSGTDVGADYVTARAVAPIDRLAAIAAPLLRPGGDLLAIKGTGARAELAAGWAAVQRANMTRTVALLSVDEANASADGAGASTSAAAAVATAAPLTSWLPGLEVTCLSTWTPSGTELEVSPAADQELGVRTEHEVPGRLALVLRLGRPGPSERVVRKGSRAGG